MEYKKIKWVVVAKDYNSPYFRNNLWTAAILKYRRLMDIPSPILGIVSRDNHLDYIGTWDSWQKTHEALRDKINKDYRFFDDLIDKTLKWGEEFCRWTKLNLFEADLKNSSNEKLFQLLEKFIDGQSNEYAYGTALPMLDFQKFSFVEGNLNRFLDSRAAGDKRSEYYSVFTEPAHNSFAQDQEEVLLAMMSQYYSNQNWRQDVLNMEFSEIQEKHRDFYQELEKHAEKYAWVYYVYMGPAFRVNDFYGFVQDYLRKNIDPAGKLAGLKEKKVRIKILKEQYIKELEPDKFNEYILRVAGKVVWAKPRRKDYQSQAYYHAEKLLREIARRLYITLDQVRSLPYELIGRALKGEEVDLNIANEIRKKHACLPEGDGVVDLIGAEVDEFVTNFVKEDEEEISGDITEFKGVSACAGRVKGVVKVINLPDEMAKMEYGNILVSVGTMPSLVPAMKKAAAIITNEGGLTCHAAIVSRELNIPCVVGTKIATGVLQDGDVVEIDAGKGEIKILKKSGLAKKR